VFFCPRHATNSQPNHPCWTIAESLYPVSTELRSDVRHFVDRTNHHVFLLHTAELFDVISDCGLEGHSYADDTQAYLSVPATDAAYAIQQFERCFGRIESWMIEAECRQDATRWNSTAAWQNTHHSKCVHQQSTRLLQQPTSRCLEDFDELRVTVFRCSWTQLMEQPSSWTAIDWYFDHFSP